jgi:hypothetical protein
MRLVESAIKHASSKYTSPDHTKAYALFSTDEQISDTGKSSIIFGYSDQAVQQSFLKYKKDLVLPGVIKTIQLVMAIIVPIWFAVGGVWCWVLGKYDYSWLQFALGTTLSACANLLFSSLWKRGILDLYWEFQIVVLMCLSCIMTTIGQGMGLFGSHNFEVLKVYYNYSQHGQHDCQHGQHDYTLALHIALQWMVFATVVFFLFFGYVLKIGIRCVLLLNLLLFSYACFVVYGSASYNLSADLLTNFNVLALVSDPP